MIESQAIVRTPADIEQSDKFIRALSQLCRYYDNGYCFTITYNPETGKKRIERIKCDPYYCPKMKV